MMLSLFKFKGGIKPPSLKHESADKAIRKAPLPRRLVVPLRLNSQATGLPSVVVDEHVLKGQPIGHAEGGMATGIHAPTSGRIIAIENMAYPHPSGLSVPSIIIEADGEDRWHELIPFDAETADPKTLRSYLQKSGIIGLGGAGFPTHIKLSSGNARIDTLIINGAECEPMITCDDRLMRERAAEITAGARIMKHAINAERIIIGIEDNKPEAVAAMQTAAASDQNMTVIAVPTLYPAGGEKQLIRVLTGIEIPFGKLGFEFGVQCFNVGTAYAVYRAVTYGEPLISRVVTVTGNVENAGNWEVPLGMLISDFVALGGVMADTDRFLMGGPMMGFALTSLDAPLIKTSNCIIAGSSKLFPPSAPELPCIRCGSCSRVCPQELQPFEMYWFSRAKNFGKTQEYNIFDCIECGCCSYVCPSHIPLVQYFRFAKSEIRWREREKSLADAAKARFEFRNERDEREKAEKAARLAKAAAAKAAEKKETSDEAAVPAAAPAAPEAPVNAEAAKKAAIAAAMERARAQREAVEPKNTDGLTIAQRKEIAEIEARRAGLQDKTAPDTEPTEARRIQSND